jgi:hypothetical protein
MFRRLTSIKKSKAPAIAEALLPPYEKYTHHKNSILFITCIIFIVKKIFKNVITNISTLVVTFGTHIDMHIVL